MCEYSNKKAVMAKFKRSFGEGVGSILSLNGGYIQMPLGSLESDAEMLRRDWECVGGTIRSAYNNECNKTTHILNHGKSKEKAQ